jgi:hypothetical protein
VNIDLGSPVFDIAIGLSFVFFLLSLIASALSEFWAGVFNLRAKNLKQGLEGMLGDKEAVEKLLGHELVRTELDKEVPDKRFSVGRALESVKPRGRRTYERTPRTSRPRHSRSPSSRSTQCSDIRRPRSASSKKNAGC